MSRKKNKRYLQRDEKARDTFKQALKKRVFIDESGLDETLEQDYGRTEKGKRLLSETTGKQTVRTSIIAGLIDNKAIAPMYFQGYCDTQVVLSWLKKRRLPSLTPGMTLIVDKASFHQSTDINDAMEAAGCQRLFLPPYSPDYNPVAKRTSGHLSISEQRSKPELGDLENTLHSPFNKLLITYGLTNF